MSNFDYTSQFSITRSLLVFMVVLAWVLATLFILSAVVGLFGGAVHFGFGSTPIVILLLVCSSSIFSAALFSAFLIGAICLIDIRNMTALKSRPTRSVADGGRREVYFGNVDIDTM